MGYLLRICWSIEFGQEDHNGSTMPLEVAAVSSVVAAVAEKSVKELPKALVKSIAVESVTKITEEIDSSISDVVKVAGSANSVANSPSVITGIGNISLDIVSEAVDGESLTDLLEPNSTVEIGGRMYDTDDGHILARVLGGAKGIENMLAMRGTAINQSVYKRMANEMQASYLVHWERLPSTACKH